MSLQRTEQEISELRKKFIVAEADFAQERLASLVEQATPFCILDEQGNVHLRRRDLPQVKRLCLCLVARFIGSKMDDRISAILSADELSAFLGVGKAEVFARAKELIDGGFAARAGRGNYRMNPARIDDFFETLTAHETQGD